MFAGNNFNILFLLFGIFSSASVALISYQMKLIDKNSQLLYLSIGFYKHFLSIYIKNFYKSILLLFELAIQRKSLHPTLHVIEIKNNFRFNSSLLIATINMTIGIFTIGIKSGEIFIHTVHEDYFYDFDLLSNVANLNNVNDDDLV